MRQLKSISKYGLVFIILIIIYFISLFLTSILPTDLIKDNAKKSSDTLIRKGDVLLYDIKYKKETLFLFTDAIMVNTAYSIDNNNPLESMLLARRNYIPNKTEIMHEEKKDIITPEMYTIEGRAHPTFELYGLMHDDENREGYEYPRYWHGYLVFLRPLLILFDYSIIRIISNILLLILLAALVILIWKKINFISALVYLIGFLSVSIFIVGISLNEATTFYIAIISSIILLIFKKNVRKRALMLLFITGSVTSFSDLFTTPLITLCIPLITYFLIMQKNENINIKQQIIDFVILSVLWGIGYGLTWATKWIITDLILGKNIIQDAFEQILFRTRSDNNSFMYGILSTVERIRNRMSDFIIIINLVLIIIIAIVGLIKNRKKQIKYLNVLVFIIISLLPICWYIIIREHSETHSFFTYRIYLITIMGLYITIAKLTGYYENNIENNEILINETEGEDK